MARRKKHHKKHHHRRRVGAMNTNSVGTILGMMGATIAGMAGVRALNAAVTKMLPAPSTTSSMNYTGIGLGLVEAAASVWGYKKVKSPIAKVALIAAGSAGAVYALGSNGAKVLPASIGYPPPMAPGYRAVPKVGFPKPNNIGFPKPNNIGSPMDREKARVARMYAGVYTS